MIEIKISGGSAVEIGNEVAILHGLMNGEHVTPAAPKTVGSPEIAVVTSEPAPVAPVTTRPVTPFAPTPEITATPSPPVVPTTTSSYTQDQLAYAAAALMETGKQEALIALLGQFGVKALTQLPQDQYGAFAMKLRELGATI